MTAIQHRPQSRAAVEAEERRNFGDRREKPGPRLEAKPLSAHELQVFLLRREQTREVFELGRWVVDCPGTLREAVARLVKAVDNLNCIIAGIAIPDTLDGDAVPDPLRPEFSGLTVSELQAKRICLCLGAKRAGRFLELRMEHDAIRCCREALATCFGEARNG